MTFSRVVSCGIAFALCAAGALPATAQWMHRAEEDPFSGSQQHLAVGAVKNSAVGFRCSDDEELTLLFMTPESADDDTAETLNLAKPKILFRVDDGEVIALNGEAIVGGNDTLSVLTRDVGTLEAAQQASGARTRIAVAIEVLGQRFHPTTFGVVGSTASIKKNAGWVRSNSVNQWQAS